MDLIEFQFRLWIFCELCELCDTPQSNMLSNGVIPIENKWKDSDVVEMKQKPFCKMFATNR